MQSFMVLQRLQRIIARLERENSKYMDNKTKEQFENTVDSFDLSNDMLQ